MTQYRKQVANFFYKHPHILLVYSSVLVFMFWMYVKVVFIVMRDYVRCIGSQKRIGRAKIVSITTAVTEREESNWSREVISVNI